MSRFFAPVEIFIFALVANEVYQAKSEAGMQIVDAKGLNRHPEQGVFFANFVVSKFHYLNITPVVSTSVDDFQECGIDCVDHSSCFAFNEAAFRDMEGKILCELLPSDKYNKSSKFVSSQKFHHCSIKTPCFSDPCLNSATCVAKYEDNAYQCVCAPGYSGRNCETDKNECLLGEHNCSSPELCINTVGGFRCSCPPEQTQDGKPCVGFSLHWKLDGTDKLLNLRGAAKFEQQDGRTVLFLDGIHGTYAETPSIPVHSTNLTIALWIKLAVLPNMQIPIYGDWSSPFSFRIYMKTNGHLCAQARDQSGADLIGLCTDVNNIVPVARWSHVAMTWSRADRTVRLFINGEMKLEHTVAENRNLDFMNTAHSVYDIGLKRDSGKTVHAHFSDLMLFSREFQYSPSENVNETRNGIFLNHPLYNFI